MGGWRRVVANGFSAFPILSTKHRILSFQLSAAITADYHYYSPRPPTIQRVTILIMCLVVVLFLVVLQNSGFDLDLKMDDLRLPLISKVKYKGKGV